MLQSNCDNEHVGVVGNYEGGKCACLFQLIRRLEAPSAEALAGSCSGSVPIALYSMDSEQAIIQILQEAMQRLSAHCLQPADSLHFGMGIA